ncbi:MAG TPA: LolA-related protein [Alphaproteobacteria bacterium]|nr:LolA-related protein [Alphaproteobacteria bacterium]
MPQGDWLPHWRRMYAFALVLATTPTLGLAEEIDLERLMASMAKPRQRHATFIEERRVGALTEPLRTSGKLEYRAPSWFARYTEAPVEERLIVDDDSLVIERPTEGVRRSLDLASQPELRAIVEAIRAPLSGDTTTLRTQFDVTISGDDRSWRLDLRPRAAEARALILGIVLEGAGDEVLAIETFEANGDSAHMRITPVRP